MRNNNQPILKNLGYINPGSWLQNEDFRYNIRGWLMSINNSKLTPDGGKTNSDLNDVFGMQLMYDKADSSLTNTVRYNGRPSGSRWMTRNYSNTRTRERSFLYYYNGFGHYSGESYAERDSTSTGTSPYNINRGAFNETSLTYDLNGNLVTLSRNSSNAAGSFYQIDTLKYTYNTNNQNQLIKVTDGTDSVHTGHGFRSIDSTANYEYDANGNLYNDHFKGMQLRYNVLNRTDKINITTASGQSIDYTYDADGNLLRKRAYSGGTLQTTTDYIDGFVYITIGMGTPALSYFPMPEGRVVNVSGTLTQEFIMTDQQGNARVAFRNVGGKAKVFQENSYYGTGLLLPNSPVSTPSIANKKLYNGGSEWQNDSTSGTYNLPDYYETFNRNYDATIGRFIGVDPMAESAEHLSSYQYAGCNPIVSNDPDGDLLDLSKVNKPAPLTGPTSAEFDFENEEVGGGTDLASFYGDVAGVTGGYAGEDSQMGAMRDAEGLADRGASVTTANGTVTSNQSAIYFDLLDRMNAASNNSSPNSGSVTVNYTVGENLWTYAFVGDDLWRFINPTVVGHTMRIPVGGNDDQGGIKPNMMFYGVPVYFSTVGALKYGAAFTLPGIGIFINPNARNDKDLLRHEFGHWLIALAESKNTFYTLDVPLSILSAMFSKDDLEHQKSWTETRANDASYIFFGRPADWNFDHYHVSYNVRYPVDPNAYEYPNVDAGFASGFH